MNLFMFDRRVWIVQNLGGEFVRRADDHANFLPPAQQLFHEALPCLARGSND